MKTDNRQKIVSLKAFRKMEKIKQQRNKQVKQTLTEEIRTDMALDHLYKAALDIERAYDLIIGDTE